MGGGPAQPLPTRPFPDGKPSHAKLASGTKPTLSANRTARRFVGALVLPGLGGFGNQNLHAARDRSGAWEEGAMRRIFGVEV